MIILLYESAGKGTCLKVTLKGLPSRQLSESKVNKKLKDPVS